MNMIHHTNLTSINYNLPKKKQKKYDELYNKEDKLNCIKNDKKK